MKVVVRILIHITQMDVRISTTNTNARHAKTKHTLTHIIIVCKRTVYVYTIINIFEHWHLNCDEMMS